MSRAAQAAEAIGKELRTKLAALKKTPVEPKPKPAPMSAQAQKDATRRRNQRASSTLRSARAAARKPFLS